MLKLIGSRLLERDRLPSVRQLASTIQVSAWTVSEAYQRLLAQGVITSQPGSGYFVARAARSRDGEDPPTRHSSPLRPVNSVNFVRNAVDPGSHAMPVGSGFLPRSWMDKAIPASVVGRLLREPLMTTPAPTHGLLELRRQLSTKLSMAGIHAPTEQIVTTFGVTHAIQLICRHLLKPGDSVVIEDPSYMVQQTQLRDAGARLFAVPRRHDGPDLEALERIAREVRPRLVFTQGALHNPTGTTSSPANCYGLLSLAERHDFLLVEDDAFGDLAPDTALRLAALDAFRRVFYVGSFTKVLSPAVRVGFVVGPPGHVEGLIEQKVLGVLTGSSLQESVVSHTLRSGGYGMHVNRLRRKLAKSHHASRLALSRAGVRFDPTASQGLFLWGEVPASVDVERMHQQAHEEGILLTRGSIFSPTGAFEHHLRFNVAHAADPRFLEFIQRFTGGSSPRPTSLGEMGP
ncbi:MAG: aminotransferase class I/II-fold pyridoxal phosphate-dependent enzyme [Hydrogenophaga sp.]|nr:aminotransferase class I/II-fold pyridoxal phosphate-dependent enzyme [Hydrogenophaga sp.]NIN25405.1 aminotransferase class I/II-fold pyridoxal phosphate-dependent enzyme [Hydrogenophaga sp.]NIN32262.1 aminotransferase class I/II-fold pyridoxal phosphate-dependent enzyme [Hydrogenophaga sp.]NIN56511.1 aminotransferase class I/II-fold pyridoxal phosphate-dependent enzyme [Hydrogenophaga sp.]NIO52820.1 aminotransferase class I/II-fold pyridoxal phosphate-dependent enzyme [Hydrogenophaga sp.]